jgi:Tfp pilus assembly protein PilO
MAVRARTSEKTLIIIYVSVFVVLIGVFVGLSYKTWKEIELIRAETEELRIQIADLEVKIAKLPALRKQRNELLAQMAEYEKMLPDAKDIAQLMTTLSDQAGRSDCSISDFTLLPDTQRGPAGTAGGGAYKKVKFTCTVSSAKRQKGYYSACRFLNLLELYERFIAADNFTLSAGTDAETSMGLNLAAHTYTFTGVKPGSVQK